MNKRLPLLMSLLAMIVLAASLAYWIMQLIQPPQRPIAAVPLAAMPDPPMDAAATLFGGQIAVASATNYQLTGVVSAGRDSVAILVADNAPPKALRLGRELSPGITLKEVHPRYVMLSDNGIVKRVDLAADAKAAAPMGGAPTPNPGMAMQAPSVTPVTPAGTEASPALGAPVPADAAPANVGGGQPPLSPGAVSQQLPGSGQIGPSGQAPAQGGNNQQGAPAQMAPPSRSGNSPVSQVPPTQ